MSPAGDDRPPRRTGGSEGGGKPEEPTEARRVRGLRRGQIRQEARVHGLREGRSCGQKRSPPDRGKPGERTGEAAVPGLPLAPEPARPFPQAQPGELRAAATAEGGWRAAPRRLAGGKRPWLRWVLIVAVGWLLLSFITFAISAQIQKGKLPQSAKDALKGGPAVLPGPEHPHHRRRPPRQDAEQRQRQRGPGPAARRHDHGPARLADLVPQALDPARQLRGDPELRRSEDQRLPCLQHAQSRTATPPRPSRPSRTSSASTSTTS